MLSSPAGGFDQSLGSGLGFRSSGSGFLFRSQGQELIGVGSGRCPRQREHGVGVEWLGVCVSGCSCFIWEKGLRS